MSFLRPTYKYGIESFRRQGVAIAILVVVSLTGCGGSDGPERVVVEGRVTYSGTPVSSGRIRFMPMPGYDVPMSGAYIVNGTYRIDAGGGVPIGRHRIEITSRQIDPKYAHLAGSNSETENELPKIQIIPPQFNEQSTLELEVPSGSDPISKDFDL